MKTESAGANANRICIVLYSLAALAMLGCVANSRLSGEPRDAISHAVVAPDALMSSAIDVPARLAALEERAELRAYFGAPPVIPHEIDQFDSQAACMTCHADDPSAEDPKVPHKLMSSCTQCHALQLLEMFEELDDAGNTFAGLPEPAGGHRAWKGAPPAIPHPTLLRSECLSCHGPDDHIGLRTSHPERLSCRQCHHASATLDQRAAGEPAAFLSP